MASVNSLHQGLSNARLHVLIQPVYQAMQMVEVHQPRKQEEEYQRTLKGEQDKIAATWARNRTSIQGRLLKEMEHYTENDIHRALERGFEYCWKLQAHAHASFHSPHEKVAWGCSRTCHTFQPKRDV